MRHNALYVALLTLALIVSGAAHPAKSSKKESGPAMTSAENKAGASKGGESAKLDVNSASKEELVALPGVGNAYAQKIIDGRPYANKRQLVSKGIVPGGAYKKFAAQVIAKQATNTHAKATMKGKKSK